MNPLRAVAVAVKPIVKQHHCRFPLTAQQMPYQPFIAFLKMRLILIIDAELNKHHIRPGIQQILLRPGRAEMGGSAANSRIHTGQLCLGKPLLPPVIYQRGITVLLPGSQTALGDGAAQKSYGDCLPFLCPGKYMFAPLRIPPDILPQGLYVSGQFLCHPLRLRFADMPVGSPAVIAEQKMMDPPIPQTGAHRANCPVPVFMMIQDCSHADNMRLGMDFPQPAHQPGIPFPPGSSLLPLIILPAEIPGMGVVLPYSQYDHLGPVQGKIPLQGFALPPAAGQAVPTPQFCRKLLQKLRLILHFIKYTFHALLLRLHEITDSVHHGNAALGNGMKSCPQFPGSYPRIGIITVGKLPIVLRVRLPAVIHRFRHLSRGHGVPIHFYPPGGQRPAGKQFQITAAQKSVNLHHMAGILAFKQQQLMAVFCPMARLPLPIIQKDSGNAAFRQFYAVLLPVQDIPQEIIPISTVICHQYLQAPSPKPDAHTGSRIRP